MPRPTFPRGEEARQGGEYERARRDFEEALPLFEEDGDWAGRIRARIGIASVMRGQGNYAASLKHLERTLDLASARLGPDHPEIARIFREMADAEVDLGRHREALEHYGRALEQRRAAARGEPTLSQQLPVVQEVDSQHLRNREDQTPQSRLPGVPWTVDTTGALHVPPEAGSGRDAGSSRRRTIHRRGDESGSGGRPPRSVRVTRAQAPAHSLSPPPAA